MTSLIFGSIYLGHKGFVEHRREKQRQKNYQRWEGLRDEYDEQRRIGRESRSLDIQRTGADYTQDVQIHDRPILTLRDQQEANDARTGWRPQESWDDPQPDNRRASVEVTAGSNLRPILKTKTGSTWDEALPNRLPVTRRNWDDYQPSNLSGNVSQSASLRVNSSPNTPVRDQSVSRTPSTSAKKASPLQESSNPFTAPSPAKQDNVEVIENEIPGGAMAALIESSHDPAQSNHSVRPNLPVYQSSQQTLYSQASQTPFSQTAQTPFSQSSQTPFSQLAQTPFSQSQQTPFSQPQQTPFSQIQQTPFSQPRQPPFSQSQQPPYSQGHQPSFEGFRQNPYVSPAPPSNSHDGSMHEWWNRS